MERGISDNEIKYLLEHLAVFYSGTSLASCLLTGEADQGEASSERGKITIPLSMDALDTDRVITIKGIAVLFPCSEIKEWFSKEGKSIRFHHDILKSAFYLLSGYQEYMNRQTDEHGRFMWKSAVQYTLGFTGKPVVNYYFEVILEAFELFCSLNKLEFHRIRRALPMLFLSHDVDRIRKYSLRDMAFVSLQLPGIKPNSFTLAKRLKNIKDYSLGTLLFRKDPYWNFGSMLRQEKELDLRSTWFFLEKTKKDNSKYHFHQKLIRELIRELSGEGHEIGIHGTLESSEKREAMDGGISRLNEVCDKPVKGIRQHYLKYSNPLTTNLQIDAGLIYDASLGFAEQAGFRNSYVFPFRLYDFDRDRPAGIWQLPLNVMDVTLIGYMGLSLTDLWNTIGPLVDEVLRFNGVFSLLWHNCRLDEEEYPGINEAYQFVLEKIMKSGFVSMTGIQVLETFLGFGASENGS